MRRTTTIPLPLLLVALLLAAGTWACGGDGDADGATPAVTAATDLDATALGSLGARLHAAPERAEEILAEAGLDYAAFEQAVRAVASDVEASRRYREAFEATRRDPLVTANAKGDPAS
jgi:hypothetical protein